MNIVKKLNEKYAQVKIGSKVRIWDGEDFLTREDFVALEAGNNTWTEVKGIKKPIPNSKIWLQSPERRTYDGVVFYPGEASPGKLNLWRGFALQPKPGRWSLFKEHIFENICQGRRTMQQKREKTEFVAYKNV